MVKITKSKIYKTNTGKKKKLVTEAGSNPCVQKVQKLPANRTQPAPQTARPFSLHDKAWSSWRRTALGRGPVGRLKRIDDVDDDRDVVPRWDMAQWVDQNAVRPRDRPAAPGGGREGRFGRCKMDPGYPPRRLSVLLYGLLSPNPSKSMHLLQFENHIRRINVYRHFLEKKMMPNSLYRVPVWIQFPPPAWSAEALTFHWIITLNPSLNLVAPSRVKRGSFAVSLNY